MNIAGKEQSPVTIIKGFVSIKPCRNRILLSNAINETRLKPMRPESEEVVVAIRNQASVKREQSRLCTKYVNLYIVYEIPVNAFEQHLLIVLYSQSILCINYRLLTTNYFISTIL